MIESLVFAFMGLMVAFQIQQAFAIKRAEVALLALTVESQRLTTFDPADLFIQMKNETADLVHDIMGSMQAPSIVDHLGGVISQFAQMRMMKMMQLENMALEASNDSLEADL